MPPHEVYCEPFVGNGHILRTKRPAGSTIVIDSDADVAAFWRRVAWEHRYLVIAEAVHGDAIATLAEYGERISSRWLIYADPPYVRGARRNPAPLYRDEMTDQQHRVLIALLRSLPARVMLSGYRCALYDDRLQGWRRIDYLVQTHAGLARESLWCNFPEPVERHDYTYIGRNFREREKLKRRRERWTRRLAAMPGVERAALISALNAHRPIGQAPAPSPFPARVAKRDAAQAPHPGPVTAEEELAL